MARTKRKWTREEIEQALRDNERINATPAAPEEPAAKKRRQARRRAKRHNLNKEFQALNVTGTTATVTAVESHVAVGNRPAAPPQVLQERPVVPAVAPVVPTVAAAVATTREQAPTLTSAEAARRRRAAMLASQKERTRARDRERARIRRANMTGSQRERQRRRAAEFQRARRASVPEAERSSVREENRLGRANRRSNQTEQQREIVQETDRLQHAQQRQQETPHEREERQERERVRQEERRGNMTQEQAETERAATREYHAVLRDALDEEQREEQRQQERIRRSTLRRGHALANQEDFRVSMLSGDNIVDGRHRLPPTTVCPHCNAWKWPAESKKGCCLEGAVQLPPLPAAPPRLHQLYTDAEFRRRIRAYKQVFAFTSIGASCSNRYNFRDVNQDESVAGQRGVYTYRIQGAMGHYLGFLLPRIDTFTNEPMPPKFAQIYIVDPDMQQRAERR